jgi:O-acetyl-ADP-ribose deacetylase (regulator of RNase III)
VNPYLAARAALLLIKHGVFSQGTLEGEPISSVVKRVAFPGLGTGVGQVPPDVCARQMRAAIEQVVFEKHAFPTTWSEASERHQRLYCDRVRDLQFEE